MGLDITAYSNLTTASNPHEDLIAGKANLALVVGPWDCEVNHHIKVYAHAEFEASTAGLKLSGAMQPSGYEFVFGPCMTRTDATETHRFRAGSYGGYGRWRSWLASISDDFHLLTYFADNEGTIGPDAARTLHAAFVAHRDAASLSLLTAPDHAREYYMELWNDWELSCALAADGGLIDFH